MIQQICLIFEEYQILEDKSISFSFYHMPLSIKGRVVCQGTIRSKNERARSLEVLALIRSSRLC